MIYYKKYLFVKKGCVKATNPVTLNHRICNKTIYLLFSTSI